MYNPLFEGGIFMTRFFGTVSRGVRAPIIREGDNIVDIVVDSVWQAHEGENTPFRDKDVICVTEAVVARAQGNYATVDEIAEDVRQKFPSGEIGLIFPILSRNRFSVNLRGIARGVKKIHLLLSYPSDEVGNQLISEHDLEDVKLNPWQDLLTLEQYREYFGQNLHPFTGVDYIDLYQSIAREEGCEMDVYLANDPTAILRYVKDVLTCDIHSRHRTKKLLEEAGAETLYNLEDILSEPVGDSGYNPQYGLLGSNKSTEESVKLFPRDCQGVVEEISRRLSEKSGKKIEAMIYGDGAFRDPVGKIWELADPVVSPAFTAGLEGVPHEIKLKYLADNDFADLKGQALDDAIKEAIRIKDENVKAQAEVLRLGTTPRRITDLLGSLADLTSGSGDKGTPIIWIQGYFDDLTD